MGLYEVLTQYELHKKEILAIWENAPLKDLEGRTPAQAIKDLDSLEQTMEVFSWMAQHTDEDIPPAMTEKLKSYGQSAVSELIRIAAQQTHGGEAAEYVFVTAVSALGGMGLKECVEPLIQLADEVQDSPPELDLVESALKNIGVDIIEPILKRLENGKLDNVEKMLLYALAGAGAELKSERIYQRIRTAFRTMDDKLLAVVCFMVYGDGRAVPMLRSFLQNNAQNLSKNIYYEILGAIRALGGDTEELLNRQDQ